MALISAQVTGALTANAMWAQTLLVFSSDNGGREDAQFGGKNCIYLIVDYQHPTIIRVCFVWCLLSGVVVCR